MHNNSYTDYLCTITDYFAASTPSPSAKCLSALPARSPWLKCAGLGLRANASTKRAGLERLLHKLREGMGANLIASVLSLDFKNAFNSVLRAHIAREVAKVLPCLSRFFHLAYSRPAKLFLRRRGAPPPRRPSFTGWRAAGRPPWLALLRHRHYSSPTCPSGPFPRP